MSDTVDYSQEGAVRARYSRAAQEKEASLCCPVDYDQRYFKAIPQEVIDRDYGCGDPSQYLNKGETVLDLGSGTGKICFIASQVVGAEGRVIGVDMTDDMLEVARRSAPVVAENIGYANVSFRKGRIQDLKLDLDALDAALSGNPVADTDGLLALEETVETLRREQPLVEDASIDVVVSNCVLNLVDADKKRTLFAELYRVLKDGGRAVISDIVSDRPVAPEMREDPELWSGCLSGAFTESDFLTAFEEAGFHGIRYRKFDLQPWRIVDGIVFRSVTVEAFKAPEEIGGTGRHAVIYKGPYRSVEDEEGNLLRRGERVAVSDQQLERYRRSPYKESLVLVGPENETDAEQPSVASTCGEEGSSCC